MLTPTPIESPRQARIAALLRRGAEQGRSLSRPEIKIRFGVDEPGMPGVTSVSAPTAE